MQKFIEATGPGGKLQDNIYNPDICCVTQNKSEHSAEFTSAMDRFLRKESVAVVSLRRTHGKQQFAIEHEDAFRSWIGDKHSSASHHDFTLHSKYNAVAIEITESGESTWDEKLWQLVKSWAMFEAVQAAKRIPIQPMYVLAFNSSKNDFGDAMTALKAADLSKLPLNQLICFYAPFRNLYSEMSALRTIIEQRDEETNKKLEETNKKLEEAKKRDEETNKKLEETNKKLDAILSMLSEKASKK
jgi:hypothetical protein